MIFIPVSVFDYVCVIVNSVIVSVIYIIIIIIIIIAAGLSFSISAQLMM